MIHINLLPVREIRRLNKAKHQIFMVAGLFACLLVALTLFFLYQINQVNNLKQELAQLEAEKQQFTKILNEIKKLEEEKKILQTRIGVIKQLKTSSSLTVHVLDEVAGLTPSNRMWLKNLAQTGNQLTLNGMALDNRTIAKYLDDLENSSYINNIRLANSSMEKFADRDLKSFSISGTVSMPETEKKEPTPK